MTDLADFTRHSPTSASGAKIAMSVLLGPAHLASRECWPTFWILVALDIWALVSLTNGAVVFALATFALGRAALFAGHCLSPGRTMRSHAMIGNVPAWIVGLSTYVLSLATVLLKNDGGRAAGLVSVFPEWREAHKAVAGAVDALIRNISVLFDPVFSVIKTVLLTLLSTLETALSLVPWPVFFLLIGFMAWQRGGWRVLALTWASLAYLGVFGFWDKAITTSSLVLSALTVCIVIGIPVGVAAAKSKIFKAIIEPVLDFMQTLPSFVYLLPAVAFFSIGKPPALIATVVFAVPPLIRLTCLGIEQVPGYVREAMYAHGASPLQTLLKAELPLALPSIQAGVNQCIMMSLSMVVIAALIGGGGLGYDVLFALQNVQHGNGLLAGIAIVAVAIMFDRLVRSRPNSARK